MLQPKTMTRLLIVGSKEQMSSAVTELYRHHVFHITDYTDQGKGGFEGVRIGQPMAGATELSTELIKIRSIENTFGLTPDDYIGTPRRPAASIREIIERDLPKLEEKVSNLTAQRSSAEARIRVNEQRIAELEPFSAIPLELGLYRGYDSISVIAGRTSRDIDIPVSHEKFFTPAKSGGTMVIFFKNEDRSAVEEALGNTQFQQVPIPTEDGSVRQKIDQYRSEISTLNAEIAELERKLGALKSENGQFLAACDEVLSADVEQAEAPLRFATTDLIFIADGWVPTKDVETVKSGLSQATGDRILVMEAEESEGEHSEPPVEYNNPSFAKPTELVIDTYSRPRYDELDPTLIVSIIFPLFFGIILGDIGYGAILLAFSLGLRKVLKGEAAERLLTVLRNASISAIIFGVIYAEFFGAHPGALDLHLWEPLLSRHLLIGSHAYHQADIIILLVFAVWLGILQMTLGRTMSVINHYRHRDMVHVMGQVGWIALMWGVLAIIWSIAPIPLMPDLTGLPAVVMGFNIAAVIGALLVIGGTIAVMRESPLELIEIPSILSHSLSYTRLTSVGLSSVAIAMVVNFIAIEMLIEPQLAELTPVGIIIVIFGVVVLLVGHLLNTALGLLGGGLQSLRLQYVEFFTKFYKGGGEKYKPFGMKKRLTED